MGIKFEGEPPFYLGVAETASAQVLDTNVVIRLTASPSKARSKFVPVRFARFLRKLQNRLQNSCWSQRGQRRARDNEDIRRA